MSIINLTQHNATSNQIEAGVFEPADKADVINTLTFEGIPSKEDIGRAASHLAYTAKLSGAEAAMIGGAPYLMGALEKHLKDLGITALYSFTERRSVEVVNADGSVTKTAVFAHVGWVQA